MLFYYCPSDLLGRRIENHLVWVNEITNSLFGVGIGAKGCEAQLLRLSPAFFDMLFITIIIIIIIINMMALGRSY